MPSPEPGWYPDPTNALQSRYFNGTVWTEKCRPLDPPEGQPLGASGTPPTMSSAQPSQPPPGYAPIGTANHFSNISITLGLLALLFVPPILGGVGIAMGLKAKRLGEPRSSVGIAISSAGIVLGMILGVYVAQHIHS
jgi:hypothetical protein